MHSNTFLHFYTFCYSYTFLYSCTFLHLHKLLSLNLGTQGEHLIRVRSIYLVDEFIFSFLV